MSSPRSAVSSPSSVMFSMMSASSSSVTVTAGSLCTRRATALPKAVSRADRGLKSTMKNRSERAVRMASRSAYFLAMLFGSISPAKNTTTVVTERAGGDGPHAPLPLHGHGHERCDRQVQNVRADQQRRDRLIEVVEHIQRLLGAAVAVVSGGFEPDAARGCKRCLHDGEIGRAKEQHDDNRQNIP